MAETPDVDMPEMESPVSSPPQKSDQPHQSHEDTVPWWLISILGLIVVLTLILAWLNNVKLRHVDVRLDEFAWADSTVMAEHDAFLRMQIDPRNTNSELGNFLRQQDQMTRQWILDEGVRQIQVAQAERESRSIWTEFLQKIYGVGLRTALRCDIEVRSLIEQMAMSQVYGHSLKRTDSINRILDEFGYLTPQVLTFKVDKVNPDSSKTIETVEWKRAFNYEFVWALLGQQLISPLYEYVMDDLPRLQIIYQAVRQRNNQLTSNLPPDFEAFLIAFLERVMTESNGIDFQAKLEPDGWGGLRFTNKKYEDEWPKIRKLCFRIGSSGTTEIRIVAAGLLTKLRKAQPN